MQKVKKVKKISWYHALLMTLSKNVLFLEDEEFKKELNKRKRMVKNILRLLKDPNDFSNKKTFDKAYKEIETWQKEVKYMEKQLEK